MTPVETLLRDIIEAKGPVTFREFMDIALYHPEAGYYTSLSAQIGEKGDYYTAGSLGPLFGKMLAIQLAEMLEMTKTNTLVEMGAGNGALAQDILTELSAQGVWINYFIVEKSPSLMEIQRERLAEFDVTWVETIHELPTVSGVFFSNELVDAFSVHLVEMTEDGLREVYLGWDEGFVEILSEPSTTELTAYFEELGVRLPVGFRAEVNLKARTWLKDVASRLLKGFLMTIDYGYPSHELYQDYRRRGTLMAYEHHQAVEDIYTRVGQRDLTAHVNFSALARWGEDFGFSVTGFTDQSHFLMSLGILETLSDGDTPEEIKVRLNAKSLLLPGGMGEIFKVLIQHKGLEPFPLSGLKFLPQRESCRL